MQSDFKSWFNGNTDKHVSKIKRLERREFGLFLRWAKSKSLSLEELVFTEGKVVWIALNIRNYLKVWISRRGNWFLFIFHLKVWIAAQKSGGAHGPN